jgi:methylmalonyl-CoA/ethylmalonyl-CoA epimerase
MMTVSGRPGTAIQLLAPVSDDSAIARFLANSGEGIQQIAYTVDDITAVSNKLRASGMTLLYDEPHRGTAGALINFVHPRDTGGVLIELVQPAS